MPGHGRQLGILFLDDTIAKAQGKHLMGRYLPAGLAAGRPAAGKRKGEVYFAHDTLTLSVWNGTAWVSGLPLDLVVMDFGAKIDGQVFGP